MDEMKAPAFLVYPKDYETDERVKLMTLEQEGAYWRLLMHQWIEGSIPSDVGALARLCRIPCARMRKLFVGELAGAFARTESGRLQNPRMERDRAAMEERKLERSAAGTKGAVSRWAKDGTANGSAIKPPLANDGFAVAFAVASPSNGLTEERTSGAAAPVPSKQTWLTPYYDAWKERFGAESEPPAGEMARALKVAEKKLGPMETVARWRRFLAAAERAEWSRPARFLEGLGQWAEGDASTIGRRLTKAESITEKNRQMAQRLLAKGE